MFNTPPFGRNKTLKDHIRMTNRLECAFEHVLTDYKMPPSRSAISLQEQNTKFEKCPSPPQSFTSKKTSSSRARRAQLVLEAARAKATIQMDLIDKQLQADLAMADVEDEERSVCDDKSRSQETVEEWLNKSQKQHTDYHDPGLATTTAPEPTLAANEQSIHAPNAGQPVDRIFYLAQKLKEMITSSTSQNEHRLLTRLSTPRELPTFSGDCIEWLHFKTAYNESTKICNFTDSENVWRLRRALKGEAKEAVTDLLIGNTPPKQILDALELRFGRSDIVVQHLTTQIKKLQSLPSNYQYDIVNFSIKINNCVAALLAIDQQDYLRSPELVSAITSKLPSVLLSRWMDYAFKNLDRNEPKLKMIAAFLKQEAETMSLVGISIPRDQKRMELEKSVKYDKSNYQAHRHNKNNKPVFTTVSEDSRRLCQFCKKSVHILPDCRVFRRALTKDRWRYVKSNSLCYCCLENKHENNICPAPVCDIDNCNRSHHNLLHYKKPTVTHTSTSEDGQNTSPASESSTVAHIATTTPDHQMQGSGSSDNASVFTTAGPAENVALKIVKVHLRGPNGNITTYALLDDGASISMVDKDLVSQLGFKSLKSSSIKLIDAFGVEVLQSDAPKVPVQISGLDNSYYDVCLRQVHKLKLPMQDLSFINNLDCKHLADIKNFVCKERVVPRLLIGEDNYFLLAPLQILHNSNKHEPYATRCRLGWSIHGCYGRTHSYKSSQIMHLAHSNAQESDIEQLNNLLKTSFELDSIGISTVRRENTAQIRAVQILDETARLVGSQWEVGLPFVKDVFTMPDSFNNARSRLHGLLKNFQADKLYADRYKVEMEKLFQQGYARELQGPELSANRIWYLSHFGVQNPNKPGKLRLVFDGAGAGKVKGVSLNDYLLTGPDLYSSLLGIMLRFRERKFALMGDIKDMFLCIKIRSEDQNVLRFLWQESLDTPLKICAMQSLIFGATCSPFIAQYIRNKNALKYQDLYPEAVDVIVNNHYMDDCLHSCDSELEAITLINDITLIHKKGGFEMTRWSSNSKTVLQTIAPEALAPTALEFKLGATNGTERTLGLMWHPSSDSFQFKISFDRIPQNILNGSEPPTKAKMLGIIMSVYDLHGYLSPFIIKGKIIFQNVHRSGVDWNCRIQSEEHSRWVNWLDDLYRLRSLSIPRHYREADEWTSCYSGTQWTSNSRISKSEIIDTQMHIFCDASTKAYAAVVYWRFVRSDGCVLISFVCSKSRVSPLRPVSIPRLELQGALLAARLVGTVQKEHRHVLPNKRYFWCDSRTVLQWIRSDPRNYKPYVAHRLGEIDELTKSCEWRYIPSGQNVADIATREDAPPLTYSDVWFQGPTFLRRPEDEWPKDRKFTKLSDDSLCEKRCVHVVVTNNSTSSLPNEDNISSWMTLVRATARVLSFLRWCRRKTTQLDVALMLEAEELLIKKCQCDTFANELSCLKENKPLPSNSRLLQLSPFIDNSGILRVAGRIDKVVGIEYPARRPAILDGKHRITRLLVLYAHKKALHGANELVVNNLRQQYWILKLRPTVRSVASHCLFCRYRRAVPQPQRMGDLPAARLQYNRRPFSYSGVDFFGPLEVTVGRRRERRYGMLFTCLTIRAIHIELTEDLSADSTIMALRRMAARRGLPNVIYSDNGTNLRGADAELKRSLAALDTSALRSDGVIRGVEWRFNPPAAPEMGGAWERMIRTVKTALKVILKERAPHPDTLYTLLAEVEALVNSRPLTHVSVDPNFPEALTPNHFLIGPCTYGSPCGQFDNSDLYLRKRWRVAQRLTDMFWNRWTKEYLPTLLPRQKWTSENPSLQIGDYVLLVDPNPERSCWRHGIVSATIPSPDGRVRAVDVRTRTGVLRRPVTRVALLTPKSDSA